MRLARVISNSGRLILVGAAAAAVSGVAAGAALRPQPAERYVAAAPQQIVLDEMALTALEQAGGGWPGRSHS